jgi:hypothetical protein
MKHMQSRQLARHSVTMAALSETNPTFLGFIVEVRENDYAPGDPKGFVARRKFNAQVHGIETAMELAEQAYHDECTFRRWG